MLLHVALDHLIALHGVLAKKQVREVRMLVEEDGVSVLFLSFYLNSVQNSDLPLAITPAQVTSWGEGESLK